MEGKLIKVNDYYYLQELSKTGIGGAQFERNLGDTDGKGEFGKLSKKNCDKIFGVVDVEKLAEEDCSIHHPYHPVHDQTTRDTFIRGFNKAMELNKDKVFTLSNLRKAFNSLENHPNRTFTELVALLQPTEIEVEIVTEEFESYDEILNRVKNPILDTEGCLILKKK